MIVLDTSVVLAFMNRGDRRHDEVAGWVDRVKDDLVTTPLAVAEMDYLAEHRGGPAAVQALRRDLRVGVYSVEWGPKSMSEALEVADRYADQRLGLTDSSLVALAASVGTVRVATLDERHFRTISPLGPEPAFQLLP